MSFSSNVQGTFLGGAWEADGGLQVVSASEDIVAAGGSGRVVLLPSYSLVGRSLHSTFTQVSCAVVSKAPVEFPVAGGCRPTVSRQLDRRRGKAREKTVRRNREASRYTRYM